MVERYATTPQRVVIDVDVVVGYCVEGLGERLRALVVEELLRLAADVPASASSCTGGSPCGEHRRVH